MRTEIRAVLTQLELLSDVSASPVGRTAKSVDRPVGPAGFQNLSADQCPPEERSLYEHFEFRFRTEASKERGNKYLWFLCWEAQHALKIRTIPPTGEDRESRVALHVARADESALVTRLLTMYSGGHSHFVALDMEISKGWVEHTRDINGYDPITGMKRPEWKKLPDETREAVVHGLWKENLTQKEAAVRLGISRSAVAKVWPKVAA